MKNVFFDSIFAPTLFFQLNEEFFFMRSKIVYLLSVLSGLFLSQNNCSAAFDGSFFPPAGDRAAWQKILERKKVKTVAEQTIARAEKLLDEPVPQLPASVFMQFLRQFNRINYEEIYFQRRNNMKTLILAECFEYKGRFIEKIIDYLYATCEEYSWNLPSHLLYKTRDPLPYARPERIALYSSTTGMDLAVTLNLLEKEIATISPNMVRIIKRELDERIVEPLEIRPFPFDFINATNNWRPWCIRNCLVVMMFRLHDQPKRLQKTIDLFKDSMEKYIADYSSDGCCDEGPGYWALNPIMIMHFYDLIKEKPRDFKKFTLMADYILHVRLTDEYFVNFGDATCKINLPMGACYRYGEVIGNEELKQFSASAPEIILAKRSHGLYDDLYSIFHLPEAAAEKYVPAAVSFKYYDRLQMLFLKDRDIAIAAKRGFRGSHYHMDIGQFILFYQQKPIIIDLGAAVYTAETFTRARFRNWILNSDAHNIPQFNGIGQIDWPKFDEKSAIVERTNEKCIFKLDLTSAYPAEAGLEKCERIITYDYRDQSLEVEDKWQLKRDNNSVKIPLYTPQEVVKENNSFCIGNVRLTLAGSNLQTCNEKLVMTDAKVISNWGKDINKITVSCSSGKVGFSKMRFKPIK